MTTHPQQLSVALPTSSRMTRARHEALLATLPTRFRVSLDQSADIVVVSGDESGWVEHAEHGIGTGARGVLVAHPGVGEPAAIRALVATAAENGTVVAVESPVADPAWAAALPELRNAMNETSLADSLVAIDGNVTDAGAAGTQLLLSMGLLQQLALLRSLTPRLDARGNGGRGRSDYWVSTVAGAALVSLVGTITSAGWPSLRLDLLSGRAHWKATFYPSALARPTRVARFDDKGSTAWPETYESASRVVWRQLASAMRDGHPLAYTLADLAADLELARAFGRSGSHGHPRAAA